MTRAGASGFEGTEKKIELVVDPSVPPFRGRGDSYWRDVVRRAGADVIRKVSGDHCDAFLLSESSLFVYDHKVVMLTCGTTTLHDAALEIVDGVPRDLVRMFVYQRKNEVFPRQQPTTFHEDVQALQRCFPGRAYKFGHEDEHHMYLFHLDRAFGSDPDDVTVEILMYGLDPQAASCFSRQASTRTQDVRSRTGVDRTLPGFLVDDHLFEPTGYSLNAIRDHEYFAIHVTPEHVGSYASFETNHRFGDDLEPLLGRVLQIFKPRSYDLVLFDREGRLDAQGGGYRLRSRVVQDLECGYRVQFLSFDTPAAVVRAADELSIG